MLLYFFYRRREGKKQGHKKVTNNKGSITPITLNAAALLRQHDGPVVVSGYESDLYAAAYEGHGWQRVSKEYPTNSGGRAVECLWLNPAVVAYLQPHEDQQYGKSTH